MGSTTRVEQPSSPPIRLDAQAFNALGRRLRDNAFADASVLEHLGIDSIQNMGQRSLDEVLERTSGGGSLDTFIRLFLLGRAVPIEQAGRYLDGALIGELESLGLFQRDGDALKCPFQIVPFLHLHLLYDRRPSEGDMSSDFVMGVGGSTQTLTSLTLRRPCRATLDIGAGCGVHSLLAASHSSRVVAVDLNPRAVLMTRINAALNSLDNIEAREGSFYEPVDGERFDLIVANPPFVISPENTYVYRDTGLELDGAMRVVCEQGLAHLEAGGVCQVLGNWVSLSSEGETERLRDWFQEAPCTVLAHKSHDSTPEEYAAHWTKHTSLGTDITVEERAAQWLEHYRHSGIEMFHSGLVTIRREADGPSAVHVERTAERWQIRGVAGDHVFRMLEAWRAIANAEATREGIGSLKLRVLDSVRVLHELRPIASGDGSVKGWGIDQSRIALTEGIANTQTLDEYAARIVLGADGRRTLDEVVRSIGPEGVGDEELAAFEQAALSVARALVLRGYFDVE